MAETGPPSTSTSLTAPDAESGSSDGRGHITTERGTTTIAEIVVSKVASLAAGEVGGVHRVAGGAVARALGAVTNRGGGGDGVSVEVVDSDAMVSMTVIIDYGESIPNVAQELRENVIRRIEGITGLNVASVDVTVTDLYFPGEEESGDGQ